MKSSAPSLLACRQLTLSVPERVLCRGLSLAIAPGEIWAVLGRNGSGKTTLLHALAGIAPRPDGAIVLDGQALAAQAARDRAREIGLLLQHEEAEFWGTVLDFVLLGRYPHASSWAGWRSDDEAAAERALAEMNLAAFARRRLASLSGGERQRARIAQVLAQAPRFFLLDEPLQHLDLVHQIRTLALFRDLARTGGRAVAMVLHDALWPARYCTHALLLRDDGEPLAGPARAVLTRPNLERLYGCGLTEVDAGEGSYFVPRV